MYTPPNADVDHLDPGNWWPYYHMGADLRGVPAAGLADYLSRCNVARAVPTDGEEHQVWFEPITSLSSREEKGYVLFRGPDGAEHRLAPDALVYIAQADFTDMLPAFPVVLVQTYEKLWNFHLKGQISRMAFEVRADALRAWRDQVKTVLGVSRESR